MLLKERASHGARFMKKGKDYGETRGSTTYYYPE
jgi:hypothetical protein